MFGLVVGMGRQAELFEELEPSPVILLEVVGVFRIHRLPDTLGLGKGTGMDKTRRERSSACFSQVGLEASISLKVAAAEKRGAVKKEPNRCSPSFNASTCGPHPNL